MANGVLNIFGLGVFGKRSVGMCGQSKGRVASEIAVLHMSLFLMVNRVYFV